MSGRFLDPTRLSSGVATDLAARAVVIVLFSLMSANLFADFLRTGHVTGLLLLASESLVVVLTIVRRRTSLGRSVGRRRHRDGRVARRSAAAARVRRIEPGA